MLDTRSRLHWTLAIISPSATLKVFGNILIKDNLYFRHHILIVCPFYDLSDIYTHPHTHTHTHAHTQTYTRTHTHPQTHAHTHPHTYKHTHTQTHAYTHTHRKKHTHRQTQTQTNTQTNTHTHLIIRRQFVIVICGYGAMTYLN